MNRKTIRKLLWACCVACLIASAAVVVWAVATPVVPEVSAPPAFHMDTPTGSATSDAAALPPLDSFEAIWEKPVRGRTAVVEVAPEPVRPPPPPPRPPLRVQLLATATESGGGYAILMDERNLVQVRRPGEYIGGAKLMKVERRQIELDHNGQSVRLVMPQIDVTAATMSGGEGDQEGYEN